MSGKNEKPKKNRKWRATRRLFFEWCELEFTNKVILIIGIILFFELISSVFLAHTLHKNCTEILPYNSVFRASLSAIIGYIMGGMTKGDERSPELEKGPNLEIVPDTDSHEECIQDSHSISSSKYLRSFIMGTACVLCILTLFFAQSIHFLEYTEGLVQIRDLVATIIGFMVTHPPIKGTK